MPSQKQLPQPCAIKKTKTETVLPPKLHLLLKKAVFLFISSHFFSFCMCTVKVLQSVR